MSIKKYVPTLKLLYIINIIMLIPIHSWCWESVPSSPGDIGNTAHIVIYNRAAANISTCPDITRFNNNIKSGSNSESSHNDAAGDTNIPYWFHNEQGWLDKALNDYLELKFTDAYYELGYVCHLVADMRVPAHSMFTQDWGHI